VLRGDSPAYELLVSRYQARLVAFLWNLLGSGEDARDAAQDVFIKAYVNLGRFDRSRSFKAWLFAIAYNNGIDLLRRRRNLFNFWRKETAGDCQPPVATAAAVPLEQSPMWRPLLARITAQERSVLALKYNEDLGIGEIAAALGCSQTTVRVHLLNARRKLKKELQAAGFVAGLKRAKAEEAP
jgi:RNA polymerase sigma-70 factor (ECF subfamily)